MMKKQAMFFLVMVLMGLLLLVSGCNNGWPFTGEPIFPRELVADEYTVLLLHFNDTLLGVNGEVPVTNDGNTFDSGLIGKALVSKSGDHLAYAVPGNFDPTQGTLEFWLSRDWTREEETILQMFKLGNISLQLNPDDKIKFIMNSDDSEAWRAIDAQNWEAKAWHHIAITWQIPGEMRLYLDGVEKTFCSASEQDLITTVPPVLYIGSDVPEWQITGRIDEFRLSNIARSETEIANSVMSARMDIYSLEMNPTSIRLFPEWDFTPELIVESNRGRVNLPNAAASWSSSDPSVVAVNDLGEIAGITPGTAIVTAQYGNYSVSAEVQVDPIYQAPESIPVDPYLATPVDGHLYEIPVVILQFIPTQDGITVDDRNLSVDELKNRLSVLNQRVKFMLEEGSKFRGYKTPGQTPSLGYRVVEVINLYEYMPLSDNPCGWNPGFNYPDYHKLFEQINAQYYVETLGVKEFWIWYTIYGINGLHYELPESNMSSPLTGDVSNSERRNDDLPVYSNTYTVYQYNWERTHCEAVHNHGHQLESVLHYANMRQDGNTDLVLKKFSGMDDTNTWITGRCGWTHMPPNTTIDYDYNNPTLVLSDCEDWRPDNQGEKKYVNVDTWRSILYAWPAESYQFPDYSPYQIDWTRHESQFYIYWMQNMPGYGNVIPHGDAMMSNWWIFTGDWNYAITSNAGLYE